MADLSNVYGALQAADAAGNKADAQALANYIRAQGASQAASSAPPTVNPPAPLGLGDYAGGVGETALQLGTGMVASPLAGLAGLGTMGGRALGLTDASPADVVNSVQSGLTYSPETPAGQRVSGIASYLPQKLAGAADWAGGKAADFTGSPALGAAVNTGIQALPLALGARFLPGKAAASAAVTPEVANATSLGLKLTPQQAGAGFGARATQSLAEGAKLERTISGTNIPIVNGLAKDELGIPKTSALGKESIEEANQPAYAVINAVKKTGQVTTDDTYRGDIANIQPPQQGGALPINRSIAALQARYGGFQADDAGNLVNHIRQLRVDGRSNLKAPNEPNQNALGGAQIKIATALENQLDRHIQGGAFEGPDGQIAPDLIDQYRGARVQIAKSHTVLDALDGQNLDPVELGKQLDRGAYMDGRLRQIAVAGQNFPRALQVPSVVRNSGPFSGLGPYALAASLWHPSALAAVVAPPLARAALASQRYQNYGIRGLRQPYTMPGLLGTRPGMPMITAARGGLLNSDQQ